MPILLQCLSHSPLMGLNQPAAPVVAEVAAAVAAARAEVERFGPDLVVLFAPDHFNGFFYDMMPPFCIGAAATSVGDYGTQPGAIPVDRDLAVRCAEAVLAEGVDVALSYRMEVDHGFAQPLELLGGAIGRYPVLPVFVNGAAPPRPSCRRTRMLGEAVGRFLRSLPAERRILVVGSGGISHDPPIPSMATAPPEVAARLIGGRNPELAARAAKEARVVKAGQDFAAAATELGGGALLPLNPAWDGAVIEALRHGRFDVTDAYEDGWITAQGGCGGHEIRAWIGAFACLSAFGRYRAEAAYYRAIPEWIAGFAMVTARPEAAAGEIAAGELAA